MPDFRIGLSEYIAAIELGDKEPTVTIARAVVEKVTDPDTNKKRDRLVVFFKGRTRGWVMNLTNSLLVSAIAGSRDTDKWPGHAVTLSAKPVQFGRETVLGIRVIGSPELPGPLKVEIKMPKKKGVFVTLVPTKLGERAEQIADEVIEDPNGLRGQADRAAEERITEEPREVSGEMRPTRDIGND